MRATVDAVAVTSFPRALRDTDRPFVHTTGVWLHGSGFVITESTAMNAPRLTAWRVPSYAPGGRSETVERGTVQRVSGEAWVTNASIACLARASSSSRAAWSRAVDTSRVH